MATSSPAKAPTLPGSLAVRFKTAELAKVTATLARFAMRRAYRRSPMLTHIRVHVAESGEVTLSATDLNVSVTVSGTAWWGEAGDLCVPAKELADIVKAMPDAEVTLRRSGPIGLAVASGDAEMTLLCRLSAEFPKLPDATADDVRFVATSGMALATLIERVEPSICVDETRFHLMGIFIEGDGETTRMVTTDGHRLTRADAMLPGPETRGVILPAKAATEIGRLLRSEPGAACSWALTKSHMFVRCGAWTVASKLIDAPFPSYEQVIPKEHPKSASVERKPLMAALRRAKQGCGKGRGVTLAFASSKLTLTTDNPDTGSTSESLPAQSASIDSGERVTLGMAPGYLLDALDVIDDRFVTLAMGGELDPVLVRGCEDACSNTVTGSPLVVVIMPMRI
jgi:DNA polymerase-3 subunit beta